MAWAFKGKGIDSCSILETRYETFGQAKTVVTFFFMEHTNSRILFNQALRKTLPVYLRYDFGRNLFAVPLLGRKEKKKNKKTKTQDV